MESGFIFITGRHMGFGCRAQLRDELTQSQGFLPAIRFHGLKYKPGNRADSMGCLPHVRFSWIEPRHKGPGSGVLTGRWTGDWNFHSRKPSADGWLRQSGTATICSWRLMVALKTVFTASNNWLM